MIMRPLGFLVLAACLALPATVAAETNPYRGDGGPATKAQIGDDVRGITALPDGSILIDDDRDGRIRRVDPAGRITTLFGAAPPESNDQALGGVSALLSGARGKHELTLADAFDGTVAIGDEASDRVYRARPGGPLEVVAGTGVASPSVDGAVASLSPLDNPRVLFVGADGTVHFVDGGGHRRVGPDGAVEAESEARAAAALPDGSTLVARQKSVWRIWPDGSERLVAGTPSYNCGEFLRCKPGEGGPATSAQIVQVDQIKTTSNGDWYYLERFQERYGPPGARTGTWFTEVRRVTAAGTVVTLYRGSEVVFDGSGPRPEQGTIPTRAPAEAFDVTPDGSGVVVATPGGGRGDNGRGNVVLLVSHTGTVRTIAGTGVWGVRARSWLSTPRARVHGRRVQIAGMARPRSVRITWDLSKVPTAFEYTQGKRGRKIAKGAISAKAGQFRWTRRLPNGRYYIKFQVPRTPDLSPSFRGAYFWIGRKRR